MAAWIKQLRRRSVVLSSSPLTPPTPPTPLYSQDEHEESHSAASSSISSHSPTPNQDDADMPVDRPSTPVEKKGRRGSLIGLARLQRSSSMTGGARRLAAPTPVSTPVDEGTDFAGLRVAPFRYQEPPPFAPPVAPVPRLEHPLSQSTPPAHKASQSSLTPTPTHLQREMQNHHHTPSLESSASLASSSADDTAPLIRHQQTTKASTLGRSASVRPFSEAMTDRFIDDNINPASSSGFSTKTSYTLTAPGPANETQRMRNVWRARKMAQLFGSDPPNELVKSTSTASDPALVSFNTIPSGPSHANLLALRVRDADAGRDLWDDTPPPSPHGSNEDDGNVSGFTTPYSVLTPSSSLDLGRGPSPAVQDSEAAGTGAVAAYTAERQVEEDDFSMKSTATITAPPRTGKSGKIPSRAKTTDDLGSLEYDEYDFDGALREREEFRLRRLRAQKLARFFGAPLPAAMQMEGKAASSPLLSASQTTPTPFDRIPRPSADREPLVRTLTKESVRRRWGSEEDLNAKYHEQRGHERNAKSVVMDHGRHPSGSGVGGGVLSRRRPQTEAITIEEITARKPVDEWDTEEMVAVMAKLRMLR